MIPVNDSIEYLWQMVANHSIYVWGGQGQTGDDVTERWIRRREQDTGGTRVNGKFMTYADIAVEFWRKQCEAGYHDVLSAFDCSGLLVHFLKDIKHEIKNDISAHGLYQLTKPTTERRAGYWVFRIGSNNKASHVGQLIDENTVIHAKGRQFGVLPESYDPKYWHRIGIPSVYDFSDQPVENPAVRVIGKKTRSVNVRTGNGKKYKSIGTAHGGDVFPLIAQADESPYWYNIEYKDGAAWITSVPNYTEVIGNE